MRAYLQRGTLARQFLQPWQQFRASDHAPRWVSHRYLFERMGFPPSRIGPVILPTIARAAKWEPRNTSAAPARRVKTLRISSSSCITIALVGAELYSSLSGRMSVR